MLSAEDRFAISELLSRMAYYYDENHLDDLAASFAPDAVMSMQIGGGDMVGPFEGRDSIMELYRGAKASQTDVRRHDITNIMFDASGDALGGHLIPDPVRDRERRDQAVDHRGVPRSSRTNRWRVENHPASH
jgi:hypothetical protein